MKNVGEDNTLPFHSMVNRDHLLTGSPKLHVYEQRTDCPRRMYPL